MKRFILKFFQCLLTYVICVNIKHGLFNTIETMLVVGICFLVQYQLHVHVTQILELRAVRQVIYQVA